MFTVADLPIVYFINVQYRIISLYLRKNGAQEEQALVEYSYTKKEILYSRTLHWCSEVAAMPTAFYQSTEELYLYTFERMASKEQKL